MTAVTREVLDAIHRRRIDQPDHELFGTFRPWQRTAAESAAGVTPVNYAWPAGSPYIDPRRYHTGTVGNATDDDNALDQAILVLKQNGGTVIIPPEFNASLAVPALNLSNGQSGAIKDLRTARPISGNNTFGAVDDYIEARDSSGGYASEKRVLGKQNPAFTAVSLSDGTAAGYPRTNFSSSFLHQHGDQGQWQYLADPLFGGYYSWALIYFAGSTGKYGLWATIDSGSKARFTFCQASMAQVTGSIIGATNASPIVIQTSAPHQLAGVNSPVSISGVGGNTAANGDWEVTVLTADTFSLNDSAGNGTYTSGGTWAGVKNHGRAMVNVPAAAGSSEGILSEGKIVSELAQGTAPIITQSKTADVNLHARCYAVDASGNQLVNTTPGVGSYKTVRGSATLSGGAATVNLTGDAAFTDATTYDVFLQPYAGAAFATPTKVNGGQFTIAGTGTDVIKWRAEGY